VFCERIIDVLASSDLFAGSPCRRGGPGWRRGEIKSPGRFIAEKSEADARMN